MFFQKKDFGLTRNNQVKQTYYQTVRKLILFYIQIYSLGLVKLKIMKIYIETKLVNNFI